MQVDFDPWQIKKGNYVDPLECLMVEAIEILGIEMEVSYSKYTEKVKEVYPTTEEELIDFLNRCKLKGSEVVFMP